VIAWHKRTAWLMGLMTLWALAEPVEVVVTGVRSHALAKEIVQRLPQELGRASDGLRITTGERGGVWLVRLGPLDREELAKRSVMERLAELGYQPMVLLPERELMLQQPTRSHSSRTWQWILWGILGGGLMLFVLGRGRSTRRLHRSQDRLEKRQKELEHAIDQEGGIHES